MINKEGKKNFGCALFTGFKKSMRNKEMFNDLIKRLYTKNFFISIENNFK